MKLLLICGPWGSGTTAVAGMMASLGAQGFGPYHHTNDPLTPVSYEWIPFRDAILLYASEVTVALKPGATEAALSGLRRLRARIEQQEFGPYDSGDAAPIFFKYPLSALLLPQICAVFDTRLVYVMRPPQDIERTRLRRNWPAHLGAVGAEIIYRSMASFQQLQSHPILVVNYADLLAAPAKHASDLARFAGLDPDPDAIEEAVAFIRSAGNDGATPPPALPADQRFRRAVSLHEKERLAEAEREYRLALAAEPGHFDSLLRLGVLCSQQSRPDEAETLLRQAVDANPASPDAKNYLGSLLQARMRHEEALAYHRDAIALDPEFCEAHYDLATALLTLARAEEAAASYRSALAIDPEWPEAHVNLAMALQTLDRCDEAIASYEAAIALRPDYVKAHSGLGVALMAQSRRDEALFSFDRALALDPQHTAVLNDRGTVLHKLKRHEEALASYDRALAIAPDHAEALNNRGNALCELKRYAEAISSYERALAIKPDHADALNNRGNALVSLNRPDEALASYDSALAIKPDFAEALNNRGNALFELKRHEDAAESFARLVEVRPDYDDARGALLNARLYSCDWNDYHRNVELIENDVVAGRRAATPFAFLSVSDSPGGQLQCARTFSKDRYPASVVPLWKGERYRHDRIRLAYVSADFHRHPMAYLMAELFETHDRTRFETTAISFGPDSNDPVRRRLKSAFDRFVDVRGNSDRDTALLMRNLEIDIAVDRKGYTLDCRTGIFAFRPAPIQVNYLAYPGTMGADYIDYILADRCIIPDDQQSFYSEKVAYLPDTYQPNDSKRRVSEHTPTRVEAGLPKTGFVFCSFNNHYKITPPVFDVWMRLLHQVEDSVLWLVAGNEAAVRNLRREAERRGVAPDRLIVAPRLEQEDHLARHGLADLFLDTSPVNAHTTASDALWMGLPIVTCRGSSFAGRVAASLLNAVGLPELITDNLAGYEALALKLARQKDMLATITAKLARNRQTYPLFDADRFRRHIERAYETMWERYQRGEPPASFG